MGFLNKQSITDKKWANILSRNAHFSAYFNAMGKDDTWGRKAFDDLCNRLSIYDLDAYSFKRLAEEEVTLTLPASVAFFASAPFFLSLTQPVNSATFVATMAMAGVGVLLFGNSYRKYNKNQKELQDVKANFAESIMMDYAKNGFQHQDSDPPILSVSNHMPMKPLKTREPQLRQEIKVAAKLRKRFTVEL